MLSSSVSSGESEGALVCVLSTGLLLLGPPKQINCIHQGLLKHMVGNRQLNPRSLDIKTQQQN